jgi:CarD family transcriptional regulator
LYPGHGVAKVLEVKEHDRGGAEREQLTLEVLDNAMRITVATEHAIKAGLHRVCSHGEMTEVLAILKEPPSEIPRNWQARARQNHHKLKRARASDLAEVVRDLVFRGVDKNLSSVERQILNRTRSDLAIRLMDALGLDQDATEAHIDELLLETARGDRGQASRTRPWISSTELDQLVGVLSSPPGMLPRNWKRRFRYNSQRIESGRASDLAGVVRDLASRDRDVGLTSGEEFIYLQARLKLVTKVMELSRLSEKSASVLVDDAIHSHRGGGHDGLNDRERAELEATRRQILLLRAQPAPLRTERDGDLIQSLFRRVNVEQRREL